ncbi:hypothetical protein R2S03_18740 [Hafnia alvei]|uniref:hypothetical protein n=1 Tax=Proteus vulgaris TaxID=585 RepID=UPI00299D8BDD|nr:hypothetical protein [Proteus vulgaris]WOO49475.1 hypothetical protein R2S03_18740 [Hafnia alvei]WPF03941.1 hypothetical protein SB028_17565 [Proteus vulgaris]
MTTEPVIIAPDKFTDGDAIKWMKDKLQSIDHLFELHAKREELVNDLSKLDAEIAVYTERSALQIQSK